MRIYAIGDLHLSGAEPKPMDIFGDHWDNHWDKIKEDWMSRVGNDDVVLIPGDISWAMQLEDASVDLDAIGQLPGTKILIRGNHDYWWNSISRVRSILPDSVKALQNDSLRIGDTVFCGTRGWTLPSSNDFSEHDLKIYNRELQRLRMSLDSAGGYDRMIVLLHFPPLDNSAESTEVTRLLEGYKPEHVVFGHLHNIEAHNVSEGNVGDTTYHLVSCDYLDFKLKIITWI